MNTSEKAKLTASIRHIERFSKSGIPIYNFEVPDTAGRKAAIATTRRTQEIAKGFTFYANDAVRCKVMQKYTSCFFM